MVIKASVGKWRVKSGVRHLIRRFAPPSPEGEGFWDGVGDRLASPERGGGPQSGGGVCQGTYKHTPQSLRDSPPILVGQQV